ncbi:ATP-binding cassette domain-containing protein [Anaerococcus tetradius]|uniref:ABC transporter, ATP-binding protein n=1 Tax=Anaerococcus tetradius ATCC 35098 TaxID=525255 RepID=C2CJ01_9FIRM|nr:ATP-binding cassette domain-containing protein [Anaerococcus tetradius]EEI82440.1 ABC transporter, ATP-binding protein [Anaerococcus tetradius ATCC 35098]
MKLIINNLSKSFGKKDVIKNASYTFDQGEVYALLGRNGAGKTTLFKLITDSLSKDEGEVLLEDKDSIKPIDFKDVFFMVSEPELPKFLTGREFISFFIEANRENIKNLANLDDYLSLVDLEVDDSNRLIQDYSTGMKNKLQMIMFLILKPKVILMDEPLTNLDVLVQVQMKKIIREIHKDHIIIFSTHILQLAKDICDKIVLIHDKKLNPVDGLLKDDPNFEDTIVSLLAGDAEASEIKRIEDNLGEGHE